MNESKEFLINKLGKQAEILSESGKNTISQIMDEFTSEFIYRKDVLKIINSKISELKTLMYDEKGNYSHGFIMEHANDQLYYLGGLDANKEILKLLTKK